MGVPSSRTESLLQRMFYMAGIAKRASEMEGADFVCRLEAEIEPDKQIQMTNWLQL